MSHPVNDQLFDDIRDHMDETAELITCDFCGEIAPAGEEGLCIYCTALSTHEVRIHPLFQEILEIHGAPAPLDPNAPTEEEREADRLGHDDEDCKEGI